MLTPDELAMFRAAEGRCFTALHAQFTPLMGRRLRQLIPEPDERDDVVQQAWVRAYRHRLHFVDHGSFEAWLWRICRRIALDSLRTRRRQQLLDGRHVQWAESHVDAGWELPRADPPHHGIAWLSHHLATLPRRQSEVAERRWLLGLSTRDTASELGMSPGTVKATLNHARAKLQQLRARELLELDANE